MLKENEDKFQPHDPEMSAMSKIGLGEEFPEDQIKDNQDRKLDWYRDEKFPRNTFFTKQTFNLNGKNVAVKAEDISEEDDKWTNYYFVDPENRKEIAFINWGRGGLGYDDIINYIKIGLPRGVKTKHGVGINMDSEILKKFIDGTAKEEGFELITR